MSLKSHWEQVYTERAPDAVSWYQPHAEQSLRLIAATGLPPSVALIDVGGGASTLVDDLLTQGYRDVTVLDLSAAALETARARLGERAAAVTWLEADATEAALPGGAYDLWHDRAVFHFLTEASARRAYVRNLRHALRPGGHVVLATFATDGPERCSGLPVRRYDAVGLQAELGDEFTLVAQDREVHRTPGGAVQPFVYAHFRRSA